ncbi:MAG: hypothetical protein DMG03_21915 [Acidobacteria bacterium]|nr:MAG: hypothetical protein DMG03_21915 [Acidobacteriota bacterium]
MPRAPVVNPHRCAIGTEQTVGAEAEDVEARGQIQRRRKARRKLVEQRADVALQFVALTQAKQFERRHECVGQFLRVRGDLGGGRRLESDRDQTETLRAMDERQQQRRPGAEPQREIGRLPSDVGDERGVASLEGLRHQRCFVGSRQPWIGAKFVEAESGGRLQDAVARVVLEQKRAVAASNVERMLMQMRQHVVRPRGMRQQRNQRARNRVSALGPCGAPRQTLCSRFLGHVFRNGGPPAILYLPIRTRQLFRFSRGVRSVRLSYTSGIGYVITRYNYISPDSPLPCTVLNLRTRHAPHDVDGRRARRSID